MKGIRTIALGLALLVGTAATAEAQEAQQAGQGRGRGVAQLLEGITLAADQQAKVDSLQKAFAPKLQTARDEMMAARQNGGDASAAMTKMQAANTELYAAIKTVLTTEQQAAFDKNVEARRQRMQNRGNPPR
jgi:Spy/CpxP family protein refolding chaperone